jgi:hypothetical protein
MSSAWSADRKVRIGAAALALTLSLALHGAGLLWFKALGTLPSLDLELTKPDEVAFGVTEAPQPEPPPAAPSRASAATPQPANADPKAGDAPAPPKKPPPRPPPPAPAVAAESGAVGHFAPEGAQLALRMDLERIQASPLADDVTGLLQDIPDVRALLDGSGVDPVRDLTRLFLASPDLRREHVVMAGRYRGDESVPRAAVESLARASGHAAEWRKVKGIRVAPWWNRDETQRVVALIAPALFAITREQDLSRVIAVARALRAQKNQDSDGAGEGEGLVHMADRELMNVTVENARKFVRGARAERAPLRLELAALRGERDIEVTLHATYPDTEQASAAKEFVNTLRDRYAAHPLIALMGMDGMLRGVTLATHDAALEGHAEVPITQARLLLHFVRDALRGTQPATARDP